MVLLLELFLDFKDGIWRFYLILGYGKYLDLHSLFVRYVNLKGVKQLDYMTYLDTFYKFSDKNVTKDTIYSSYLKDLQEYLVSFIKRSQPLLDINRVSLKKLNFEIA